MANYINSVSIKESTYGLKISAPLEKLIEELRANAGQSGWVNLEIKKRKSPSEKGATHYMQVDEWKPSSRREATPNDFHDSFHPKPEITPLDHIDDWLPF